MIFKIPSNCHVTERNIKIDGNAVMHKTYNRHVSIENKILENTHTDTHSNRQAYNARVLVTRITLLNCPYF